MCAIVHGLYAPFMYLMEIILELTENYICWLAGFFDGEGSVSIGVNHYKLLKPPFRQKRYHLRITISQNVKEVLEEIQKLFGGCLKINKSKYKNVQRTIYCLCIDCLKAEKFLKVIYPYLKVKRKQAEIAIKFQIMTNSEISSEERRRFGAEFKAEVEATNSAKIWEA